MALGLGRRQGRRYRPGFGTPGPLTDANITALNANGWTANYDTPATFNPVSSPKYAVVLRPGFDSSGNPTTVTDNVLVMARQRQPYPSQASLTASTVVLSDEVYANDTIVGKTNSSTLVAPLPIPAWITPDLERARSSTFTVKLAVAHKFARAGRPVAAVKFICSDGTNTVQVLVNTMTKQVWASGLWSCHFEATIDISTLTPGSICTVDAIIYPWVGAAYQASVNGSTYPSTNFTVLKFLCDRTGSYGEAYAYCDPAGNNATGVVSANPSTAAASPFLTPAAAAAAIKTFNNSTYGRNETSGGTIRLNPGTYAHADFSTGGSANAFPLVIEASNPASKASTIYQSGGAHVFGGFPKKTHWRNLVWRKGGGDFVFASNGASLGGSNMVKLENVSLDQNGQTNYGGWIYDVGRLYLTEVDCATNLAALTRFSSITKQANCVGCSGPWGASAFNSMVYNVIACKLLATGRVSGNAGMETGNGQLISHSIFSAGSNGQVLVDADTSVAIGDRGFAVIGCVLEQYGGVLQPALDLWSGSGGDCQNVLVQCVTVVGSRSNIFYNDTAYCLRRGAMRYTVHFAINIKSDVFGANGAYVGNWAPRYQVGFQSNCYITGSTDGGGVGAASWMGELASIGDMSGTSGAPLTISWTNDASFSGSKAGNGNYRPTTPSQLPKIPTGFAPFLCDLTGATIPNDGTGVAGAIAA